MKCYGHKAIVMVFLTVLSGCGEANHTGPIFVKPNGWDSICLAGMALNLPSQVLVAEADAIRFSGYGFEPSIQGTATSRQLWNHVKVQETGLAQASALLDLREAAAFSIWEAHEKATRQYQFERISTAHEAPLGQKEAYAFNHFGAFDIGYLDPFDKRVRLFWGQTGKGEATTIDDVKAKYQELRHLYTARKPTDIPVEPGICTPYGFFKDPASGPVANYNIDIAVRSLKYPNLIIFVHIRPPEPSAPKSLDDLRDPNNITVDDLNSIKGMGAIGAIAALGNIKKLHDPEKLTIAGQPGRLSAREYHHKGTLDTTGSGSGAAYEMQADTVGVPGRADMPAITIKLAAALPDPFPYPKPVRRMSFGEEKIDYYEPKRPALKGVKTPPFEEAMAYFKQVLASVRPLPQLHGQASGDAPAAPASAASR